MGGKVKDVLINVEISDLKNNEIIAIPDNINPDQSTVHLKVDNDMESSDLNFSEDEPRVDENAYQIDRLGSFEVDKSISDQIEGINKDRSVDFSDGDDDFSFESSGQSMSRKAAQNDSYSYDNSSSSAANELDSDDIFSSLKVNYHFI